MVGRKKNSRMDIPIPISMARVMMSPVSFSLPSFSSSHFSNREGSSWGSSSPSPATSAEYIRALTPLYMEEPKLTTPRIRGRPTMG